jgi:hypothetical protein
VLALAVKLKPLLLAGSAIVAVALTGGCSLFPESRQRDRVHNPFPQLKRVAVLPFFNQSNEPTLDTELVAEKYYAALQAVPGFEVLPVGVAKAQYLEYARVNGEPTNGPEFQQLARQMGVEALVVGSVTDFDSFYPPRLAMTVHWYAANEGFHPIPPGYGLPWGTDSEKHIPRQIAREAEFELARSQLATQTPIANGPAESHGEQPLAAVSGQLVLSPPHAPFDPSDPFADSIQQLPLQDGTPVAGQFHTAGQLDGFAAPLPADWPDPTDLIPDPPSPQRPPAIVNHEPVLSHTRLYRGDDPYFTNRLADHVETGDDARPSGWQGYLKRSDDFIHFCCHLHIIEMLESRGGSGQPDLILRWPLSRY